MENGLLHLLARIAVDAEINQQRDGDRAASSSARPRWAAISPYRPLNTESLSA